MVLSLSDRWTDWWQDHGAGHRTLEPWEDLGHLPLKFVMRVILPQLLKEGYQVPGRRVCNASLEKGLEPLEQRLWRLGSSQPVCSCMHLLNMLWQPLLEYVETFYTGEAAPWTSVLEKHQALLILEMQGNIEQAEEPLPMDDWLRFVQQTLERCVEVTVPLDFLREVLAPLVPLSLAATRANALTLLRSPACTSRLTGKALGIHA